MAGKTNNIYGKIVISNKTIERFVSHVALDCYGIVGFVPRNIFEAIITFFQNSPDTRGVNVHCVDDRIFINVSVIVKFGVSIKAVIESLKEAIRYKVERYTGMIVDTVNVCVMGVAE